MNYPKILTLSAVWFYFSISANAADANAMASSATTVSVAPATSAASASAPVASAPATPPPTANATIHWLPDSPDKVTKVSPTDSATSPVAIVPDKHIELFNGKDLTGWEINMRVGPTAATDWSVADGLIKCVGKPNGYIRTAQAYKEYKVTVEWRFPPGKEGNTGVMVHMNPPEMMSPWPKCVECQGMHSFQGDFWFWSGATCAGLDTLPVAKLRNGKKNGIARPAPDAEKPVGEWNTFAVVCTGDNVTIFVNDQQVNTLTGCNLPSGWIGLQSEGAGLEIRKVSLDPLPKADVKKN
ncbi:MAG TPA: DUF1080 domain-containing protein [Opitutales bacterium]|jgi:hypothetical protein|nr:DUF1080 domain-containing protein [Opitutales bacterium]